MHKPISSQSGFFGSFLKMFLLDLAFWQIWLHFVLHGPTYRWPRFEKPVQTSSFPVRFWSGFQFQTEPFELVRHSHQQNLNEFRLRIAMSNWFPNQFGSGSQKPNTSREISWISSLKGSDIKPFTCKFTSNFIKCMRRIFLIELSRLLPSQTQIRRVVSLAALQWTFFFHCRNSAESKKCFCSQILR